MKIYHTETQEDYDALMVELEAQGCKWLSERKPTEAKYHWFNYEEKTCVRVSFGILTRFDFRHFKEEYPDVPIIKYKAKVDDKMRFTKENVERVIDDYFLQAGFESCGDLIVTINALDDIPEKVVVPKCFDEWYKEIKAKYSNPDSAKLFAMWKLCQKGFGYGFERADGENIYYESELGLWLNKNRFLAIDAVLNGYTIEPEQLYCIPLPNLETSDGTKQYLTKSGAGNYFALSPCVGQKQRYTKEELEQAYYDKNKINYERLENGY